MEEFFLEKNFKRPFNNEISGKDVIFLKGSKNILSSTIYSGKNSTASK